MSRWSKKNQLTIIGVLLTVAIGLVTNIITSAFSWPLVVLIVVLTFLAIWVTTLQDQKAINTEHLDKQNRAVLLKKIAYRCSTLLPLSEERLDVTLVAAEQYLRPNIVEYRANRPERELPQQIISKTFNESGQKILILGEPGAGKTTLLYQLALELTWTAQYNTTQSIPLIINLSSWAKRPAGAVFEDWLLSEMHVGYDIPKEYGKKLISEKQVVFLLDGLDEVAESSRSSCVESIDRYFTDLIPVVVCCRIKEYELLKQYLRFEFAVKIKSLNELQVEYYFKALKLEHLEEAWRKNIALREALTTPLMVRVAAIGFADTSAISEVELTRPSIAAQTLWRAYTHYVLHRKKKLEETRYRQKYTDIQVWRWLQWLAQTLNERNITNFYLERMQLDILPESGIASFDILDGLVAVFMLLISVILSYILSNDPVITMAVGATVGLAVGLFSTKLPHFLTEINPVEHMRLNVPGLLFGLRFGLIHSLIFGLLFSLLSIFLSFLQNNFLIGWIISLLVGLLMGLALGLGELFSPFSLKDDLRTRPNEGIYRSGKYALKFCLPGLIIMLIGFSLQNMLKYTIYETIKTYHLVIFLGVFMFFLLFCNNGGSTYYHHYILRWLLYRSGYAPFRYGRFLEFACRLGFLKRIGGGYTFFHRELRDFIVKENHTP